MTNYRVRWKNHDDPIHTYGSEVMTDLEEVYEYRSEIQGYVAHVWIEATRWEVFD